MDKLRIRRGSAWQQQGIEEFLRGNTIPLRLACNAGRGFPSLNSLWYEYRDGCFWCATHGSSAIVGYLRTDPRCAFEIAPNQPPYCGVRGQAQATLQRDGAAELLSRLIGRYLGESNPGLAAWLLSRADEEYVVRLQPTWLSAWDYRGRMAPSPPLD